MTTRHPERPFLIVLAIILATGCIITQPGGDPDDPEDLDQEVLELEVRRRYSPLPALPSSPTNKVADDALVARFGQRLFFDKRLSADGRVACASCHLADVGFSEPRATSPGVFGRQGTRHAPGVIMASYSPFLLWDGRADSMWSQALMAFEAPDEMDFTRLEVAHYIVASHREEYELRFGPLPDLSELPERARPGLTNWELLTAAERDQVNRVFSNVGKAIEAYQRQLRCDKTPLDRLLLGESGVMTASELQGAVAFDTSGCTACHSGPELSDHSFHHIGIGNANPQDAQGRQRAFDVLERDLFNGVGPYSDDTRAGQAKLDLAREDELAETWVGAFKTPSLRGVGQRRRFMHSGSFGSLREVIGFYAEAHEAPVEDGAVGEHDPKFLELNIELRDREPLLEFLQFGLSCQEQPFELTREPLPFRFDPFTER